MDSNSTINSQYVVLDESSTVSISVKDDCNSSENFQGDNNYQQSILYSAALSASHVLPNQKDVNEIPSEYEDTVCQTKNADGASPLKEMLPMTPGAPNIFENAVKVVKNLFSPAKGHGLFSRGTPQSTNSEPEVRRLLTDKLLIFNDNVKKIETLKDIPSNLNVLENVFIDDDVNSSSVKSSSCQENHDNTNDSYTSTVSRMDDSFKSAITHFEECVQKSSEPVEILDNSLNKTLHEDESLMNDTLKNLSICSSEKLNATFEVCNDQAALDYNNYHSEPGDTNLLEEELIKSQHVEEDIVEMGLGKIIDGLELTLENLKQFEGQNHKNVVSNVNLEDEKVTSQTLNVEEKTDCSELHTPVIKESDEDVFSQISAGKQFSVSSVFSEGNENVSPKVEDLQKNLSTSTVVLFKAENERVDATMIVNNDCELFSSCEEPVVADKLKNSREPSDNDVETIYSGREFSKEERPENSLNVEKTVVKELFTKDIEEGSVAENIPLASQKSYTVLHNVNSNLDRPIVLDSMSDVGKLNDIILGNTNFSDLSVICDKGSPVEATNSSNPLVENCKEKEEILTKTETLGIFNNIGVLNEVVDIKTQECDTLTQSSFQSSFHEINQCEKENFDPNQGVFDNLEKPKSDTVLTTMHNSSNKKLEKKSETDIKTLTDLEPSNHLEKCNSTPKSALPSAHAVNRSLAEISVGSDENSSVNNTFMKESYTNCEEICTALNNPTPIRRSDSPSNIECLVHDFEKQKMNDSLSEEPLCNTSFEFNNNPFETFARLNDSLASTDENSKRSPVLDTELSQLIQEQFTPTDIEKICCVVEDIPELNLSKNILIASHLFDKSFQDKALRENDKEEFCNDNGIFAGLDYLESIKGKPGRDLSRESLYTKFDPLLQPKLSTELFDISEGDKENMNISISTSVVEPLIPISPLKETVNVTAPSPQKLSAEKLNKLRELQDEISLLRESYQRKEEQNKEMMNNYENEILKMTAKVCHLQEKLKESEETEKSLVKKLNSHNESVNRLKGIVEEYFSYIEKLTGQIETAMMERQKQITIITEERDYYMNHLQSTEQAFSDVHSKYEKCKKAVELYKKNEEMYRASIDDLKERVEHYSEKIKEIQENAAKEVGRLQEKMSDLKYSHAQEISRYKAQLRKTEIKVQSIQEALDQKVKENQELAGICDELIEGKKCGR